jgi:glutamyl-tRNA synthetase
MNIKEEIRKFALANAYTHKGKAQQGAIIGKLIALDPKIKSKLKDLSKDINKIISDVNKLSLKAQEAELKKTYPEFFAPREKKEKVLPELKNAVKGKVVVRYAPNPNGPLQLGNARQVSLNKLYQDMYNGKFILRFDDTDPKNKKPLKSAYKWIEEDVKWLGVKISKITKASDRLDIYYKYATKLVEQGNAYICECIPDKWRALTTKKTPCPCRTLKDQKKRWQSMLDSNKGKGYKEGQAVLRLKTDIKHKDPAMRDFPLMRIVNKPNHPFSKKHLWPLLNFAGPIDDHELAVTHIIRGKDLDMVAHRAEFIYKYLGWKHPETATSGRLKIEGIELSTSKIKQGIENKKYTNWDDPRVGTLRALKKRGFLPAAIVKLMKDIGLKKQDIQISLENLEAENRKMLDATANRYSFTQDPIEIKVKSPLKQIKIKLHPERKETRTVKLTDTFYVSKKDYNTYKGQEIRLKDLFNIKLNKTAEFTSKQVKPIQKINWVESNNIKTNIIMPDNRKVSGLAEAAASNIKVGEVIQFERFGFCRLDKKGQELTFYYAHP